MINFLLMGDFMRDISNRNRKFDNDKAVKHYKYGVGECLFHVREDRHAELHISADKVKVDLSARNKGDNRV